MLLSDAKRFDAAARHFELAQNGYPDPYKVGFNLTLVYVNGGNYPAAIETGERLARQYRKGELYNLLSRAYEASGKTQEAYDALRTATELDPQDENNYIDLMSLCVAHENWELSLEISEIALRYIPAAGRVHLLRERGVRHAGAGWKTPASNFSMPRAWTGNRVCLVWRWRWCGWI